MREEIGIRINGKPVTVLAGTSVAAAMLAVGEACRSSVSGQSRAPFCGMGICFECRAIVNGKRHTLGCQVQCEAGMEVLSDE